MTEDEFERRRDEQTRQHVALLERYDALQLKARELLELSAHAMQYAAAAGGQHPEGSPARARCDETMKYAMDIMGRQALFLNPDDPNSEVQRALEATRAAVWAEMLPDLLPELMPGFLPEVLR